MKKHAIALAAGLGLALAAGTAMAQTTTLAQVKARGALNCGVGPGLAGFALPDAQGNWSGLDVDFCRAMAARSSMTPRR